MFCSIYYRFARVSCYKFVRCLRDLIIIHIRSTCPTGDAQHSFLSYSLSQIIFVLSQNSDKIISWTRRMKLRERERESTNLLTKNRKWFYIRYIFKTIQSYRFNSTSKFHLSKAFDSNFFSFQSFLFSRSIFIISIRWKDFSSFLLFFFSWFETTMGTMKASWIL